MIISKRKRLRSELKVGDINMKCFISGWKAFYQQLENTTRRLEHKLDYRKKNSKKTQGAENQGNFVRKYKQNNSELRRDTHPHIEQ